MSDFDPGVLGGRLRAMAESLQETSDEVRRATEQAQAETVRLGDDDGLAEVEVDGRGRVRDIRLSYAALRDADELDRLLTGLLNRALAQAREHTEEAVMAALPADVRRAAREYEEEQR